MTDKKTLPANMSELDTLLDEYLVKKAPALPANIKEIIVKFAPWITVIVMLVALPAILGVFGLSAMIMPLAYMGGARFGLLSMLSMALGVVSLVLELMALPGLFKRQKQGWKFMYYAALVSIVSSAVKFDLVSLVVGGLISLYVLFQVRSYYK